MNQVNYFFINIWKLLIYKMNVFEDFLLVLPLLLLWRLNSPPSLFPLCLRFLLRNLFPLLSLVFLLTLSCPSLILLFLFSSSKRKKWSTLNFFNNRLFQIHTISG